MTELNKFYGYFQIVFLCLSLSYMYSNEKLKPFIEVFYLALFSRRSDCKLALFLWEKQIALPIDLARAIHRARVFYSLKALIIIRLWQSCGIPYHRILDCVEKLNCFKSKLKMHQIMNDHSSLC